MQIVYHIGANCTDNDRLLKSLLRNTEAFSAQGIKVPGPGKYRRLIRETIQNLAGADPAPDTRDILIDAILDDDQATRLVMSNSTFICVPFRVFENGVFYGLVEPKVRGLQQLFPTDQIELFLGLRNPATLIPELYSGIKNKSFGDFMHGMALKDVRWSDVIRRIRACAPDARLTVWCNEDTPLIWSQLVRDLSGVDPLTKIVGGFDLLAAIMSPEGMKRFLSYLKSHPPQTEVQKRRIISAFLDKYAIDSEIEDEVDLPGWTEALLDELTGIYDADVAEISRMDGVKFIAP